MRRYNKALVNLLVAGLLFFAVIFLLPRTLAFFAPFVAGWIIALIAGPLVRFRSEERRVGKECKCMCI